MRQPLRHFASDPRLQEQIRLTSQRNSYAAIPQLQLRRLYQNYGATEKKREQESTNFANSYGLKEQDIAERGRRHDLTYANKKSRLDDAIKAMPITKLLGLGSVAVNISGNREATKDRQLMKERNALMTQSYIDRASPESLQTLWQTMPSARDSIKQTEWYRRRYDPSFYKK